MHVGPLAESRCLGLCDHDLAGFYARNKGRRRRAPRNGEGWHFITPSYQKRFPTPFVFSGLLPPFLARILPAHL